MSMTRTYTIVATISAAFIAFSVGGYYILQDATLEIFRTQAGCTAIEWSEYIAKRLPRLEEIAQGDALKPEERKFLDDARLGNVFLYKLYDPNGRLRLASDDLDNNPMTQSAQPADGIYPHNINAVKAVRHGKPITEIRYGGDLPNRPPVYVETYTPMKKDGRIIAVVEIYINQTPDLATITDASIAFGAKTAGLTFLALCVPGFVMVAMMRQLRLKRDKAKQAERAKSEFLANMSHEIRTPMNGVLGMARLLSNTPLNEEQHRFTETILHSGEMLLSILNDILDFSKIEAGKMTLEVTDFDVVSMLDSTAELMGPQAHSKGLEMPTCLAAGVPRMARGDEGRVRQILINLLSNAIKFTSVGGVTVHVDTCVEKTHGDELVLYFEVSDTGIGIPEHFRDQIFTKFTQADASTTRRHGGTGLGLAICKQLVGLMHGEIGVKANPSGGSIFWFTVRLAHAEGRLLGWATEIEGSADGVRILIVDDKEINGCFLKQQLVALGLRATTVTSAQTALLKLREAVNEGAPFDAVIIDHFMPGTDGIDLCELIRTDPRIADAKLILSSSAGSINTDEAVKRFGFDASLPKPLRPGALLRCLGALYGGRPPKQRQPAVSASQTGTDEGCKRKSPRRILVAEDNSINQLFLLTILKTAGYQVDVVANGLEAVEAAHTLPYDLIIMDAQMPEMNGVEAALRIRKFAGQAGKTPIIAVTARAPRNDRDHFFEAGMDDYISKPIDQGLLLDKIDEWLGGQKEQGMRPLKPVPEPRTVWRRP